jgi:universal stress protein E
MKRLDRILAVVDPTSDIQPAVEKAADLARAFGSALELFVCDFDPALHARPFFDSDVLRGLREDFLEERVELLENLAEELRGGGLSIETHVHWDNPLYKGILGRIRESTPDLVVKDTHYHSVLRRTVVTNTDWNLIRTCSVPLLLAKSTEWKSPPRILAALDPGHLGDKPAALDHDILDAANLFATRLEGELQVVHAFFPSALLAITTGMAGMPLAGDLTAAEIVETERKRIADGLATIAGAHGVPADRVQLLQGSAADVLPRCAESQHADILVMGAVSRSRLEEIFIGSTAERVLDRIPCDILVVKPGDFVARLPF